MNLREKAQSIWHAQRIKGLIRDRLHGAAGSLVSVRETYCTDPMCEGPATEIRIVTAGFQEIRGLVHKKPADITDLDLATFL